MRRHPEPKAMLGSALLSLTRNVPTLHFAPLGMTGARSGFDCFCDNSIELGSFQRSETRHPRVIARSGATWQSLFVVSNGYEQIKILSFRPEKEKSSRRNCVVGYLPALYPCRSFRPTTGFGSLVSVHLRCSSAPLGMTHFFEPSILERDFDSSSPNGRYYPLRDGAERR